MIFPFTFQSAPYSGEYFDANERERLGNLVQLQTQELEALKEEIQMLQHKGGHTLPPSQPPMATGSHAGYR